MATTTKDTVLKAGEHHAAGWPLEITMGDLIAMAKQKLGSRYLKTVIRTYGGGTQVEVIAVKNGYHGRSESRAVCYPV